MNSQSQTPESIYPIHTDLTERKLIHQETDRNLSRWLQEKPRTVYAGFDPTADSLHIGHLVALCILRRFQKAGHRPIAVVGGATGMIGDPSGKSEERNLLSVDALRANIEGMERQMRKLLNFESKTSPALLVNNYDWMSRWSYLEFLRDIGKNFPVNVMLGKDSVKNRLEGESGLSYTEFSYMLLQAYDFVHLYEEHGCELQVGGSDQWGNITAGIDLARRMKGVQLYGITTPLLTKSDGTKMGKTEKGAIWLSPERTSPYQFYQFWINVDDKDIPTCLRYFSDSSIDEIKALEKSRREDPAKRESQRHLAEELTRLVHDDSGLAKAKRATEIFFGAEIGDMNAAELVEIFADVPSRELPRDTLSAGLGALDALVAADLAKSKGEARRTVSQGGAYVNNRRIETPDLIFTPADLAAGVFLVLRTGKKKYGLLKFA